MNTQIKELEVNEIDAVNGGYILQIAALATATVYASIEIGRALHDATCDDHD